MENQLPHGSAHPALLLLRAHNASDWIEDPASLQWVAELGKNPHGRAARWASRVLAVHHAVCIGAPLTRQQSSWVRNQRRALSLTAAQEALLEALPRWSWAPLQDAWEVRLTELVAFISQHQRSPRVRSDHSMERALAHWYSRQRVLLRRGQLAQSRAVQLRELLTADAAYRSRDVQAATDRSR